MSSTYTFYPPGPDPTTTRRDRLDQPHNPAQDPKYLNPFSPQLGSSSASPALNTHTPAESVSTLSVHYQSSEFSEADDPFFGVNFNTFDGASPSFLDDDIPGFDGNSPPTDNLGIQGALTNTQNVHRTGPYLPLSPDKSPSLQGHSPDGHAKEEAATRGVFPNQFQTSVSPRELSLQHESSLAHVNKTIGYQLTPETNASAESSDDGLAQPAVMQSPCVTVSHWDRDNAEGSHALNTGQSQEPGLTTARDGAGRWIPDQTTGQGGLDPTARPPAQVESINDLAAQRNLDERKEEVNSWLERSAPLSQARQQASEQPADVPNDGDDNIPQREIAMGHMTENKPVPGQTYYVETGGALTREDLELMRQGRTWEDAPVPFSISQRDSAAYQPQTSQAAIERYQRMCRDNDSIVSRAATWGTRRFSLPSIVDTDVQVAGNLFKKLSLSKGDTRRPSILQGIRGLARKASVNSSKRNRPDADDASSFMTASSSERKDSQTKLAPPSPKPGWSRKQSVPSINTTLVDVGNKVASIGATHTRATSVSAASVTSPKSPSGLTLSVKKPLNRLRSKSDTSGIVDLWKRTGGPPVSNLGNTKVNAVEADDDEDDEDDIYEDGDMKADANKLIEDITPNFAGFQQHVLKLNPLLGTTNQYLVDRIAHQQCVRYKGLLNSKVKHLQAIAARNCSCGSMCIALGGSANMLDSKGEQRGLDPLSAAYDGSDGDITPLEGAINQDSFPQDIPMPPTGSLPAEFECQLCFNAKKFQKPSDWTKHVHEDVQPFTCTWDRCKEPKMFKRKADWVRHENEGHRHLEWWICDVEDCRHKCYRRDNFLQHLVREHKFVEPKVKTKAALKRAGGMDATWAKVEQCHQETGELPQNEPCRFCGKTFPSWKKLTVHLAKHMEHISLPVLKLVAKKELDEDTIISPVQEPPPRQFPPTFPTKSEGNLFGGPSPIMARQPAGHMTAYPQQAQQQPLGMYPIPPPPAAGYPAAEGLYTPVFADLAHGMAHAQINMPSTPMGHHHQAQHLHHHAQQHHNHSPHHHTVTHAQSFQSLNSQAAFSAGLPVTSAAAAGGYLPNMQAGGGGAGGYMSMGPNLEPFPALDVDAMGMGAGMGMGMQDVSGTGQVQLPQAGQQQQMAYDGGLGVVSGVGLGGVGGGLMGAADVHGLPVDHRHRQAQQQQQMQQQFTPQGSVSPYGHSPSMPQGEFYQ